MNSQTATPTRTPCFICEDLLLTETLEKCPTCGRLFCTRVVNGIECWCGCGRPTADQALAAALKFLRKLAPLPTQTIIVEDECGAVFSVDGPTDWLIEVPPFEAVRGLEHYLPTEFAGVHQRKQQQAVLRGRSGYLTPGFGVTIKRFYIKGREFTAAVFSPA